MGGSVLLKGRGLILSTYGLSISDAVFLMNVLRVKYSLSCNLFSLNKDQTRIYIFRSSLVNLIRILKDELTFIKSNITKERLSCFSNFLDELARNSYVAPSAAVATMGRDFVRDSASFYLSASYRVRLTLLSRGANKFNLFSTQGRTLYANYSGEAPRPDLGPAGTSSSSPVVPVKVFSNADLDKLKILEEVKGKAGVYR